MDEKRAANHPIRMMTLICGSASLAQQPPELRRSNSQEAFRMVLAYPFLGVFWSMLVFFLWVSWFVLLFHVIGDVFRRRDASGLNKTAWLIFLIFVPFIGVFAYIIANGNEMAERKAGMVGA
jgi:Phospholipase_D-nuclease N-terminal